MSSPEDRAIKPQREGGLHVLAATADAGDRNEHENNLETPGAENDSCAYLQPRNMKTRSHAFQSGSLVRHRRSDGGFPRKIVQPPTMTHR